ncbi:MAG: Rrf2 family transcriptional regulator, partial [Calditerrivibrio sp.]|nr:Rrf2 family transcriptional regulator [Calditerrivibrio sp.]
GGFKLKKEPKDISLYDIIVSVEGDIQINECLTDNSFCSESFHCSIHNALNTIRNNMINDLKRYTVADLMNEQNHKPDISN